MSILQRTNNLDALGNSKNTLQTVTSMIAADAKADADRKLKAKTVANDPRASVDQMARAAMAAISLQRSFRKRAQTKPRLKRNFLVERLLLEADMKVAMLEITFLFILLATLYLQKSSESDLGSLYALRTTYENHFGLREMKEKVTLPDDAKTYLKTARRHPPHHPPSYSYA